MGDDNRSQVNEANIRKETRRLEKEKKKLEKKLQKADGMNISTYMSPSNIRNTRVQGGAGSGKTRLEIIEDIKEKIQKDISAIDDEIEMLKQEEYKALDEFLEDIWGF